MKVRIINALKSEEQGQINLKSNDNESADDAMKVPLSSSGLPGWRGCSRILSSYLDRLFPGRGGAGVQQVRARHILTVPDVDRHRAAVSRGHALPQAAGPGHRLARAQARVALRPGGRGLAAALRRGCSGSPNLEDGDVISLAAGPVSGLAGQRGQPRSRHTRPRVAAAEAGAARGRVGLVVARAVGSAQPRLGGRGCLEADVGGVGAGVAEAEPRPPAHPGALLPLAARPPHRGRGRASLRHARSRDGAGPRHRLGWGFTLWF